MSKTWLPWAFETAPGGVSSAVSPDLLNISNFAWAKNVDFRGAKPATRPNFNCRLVLPTGLYQGGAYFGVQNGMLVLSIDGNLFRVRIAGREFSYEQIPLPYTNSGIIKQVWMQQTVETLVIQDGQSQAILYNGATARRALSEEVPLGKMMAYGNGRLWVAVGNKRLVAGDIRTNAAGSELKFTEVQYLSGGGSLYFPRGITGLAFIPVTGTTDYGTLLVLGSDYTESIRADITSRDDWQNYPGFVTNVLRTIGAASDWSLTEVNQDLYWRDSLGGIRSLRASLSDESGPGSAPISREVSRLVEYDSEQLLPFCSGIYFDNRLLMTSSPFLNANGGVSFRDLVSLDFANISTLQGKSAPAYNGEWDGVNWSQLLAGKIDGKNRAFGISSDEDGVNRLWEFGTRDRDDVYLSCGSGGAPWPIVCSVEYPRVDFGTTKQRKRLERCDVWLSDISGDVTLKAYWRADNNQKWTLWDEGTESCAQVTDPETETPHVWKNLLPQQRPQIKSFTIPDGLDEITEFALMVGFQFQVRLVWSGKCRVQRTMLWAQPLDVGDFADRETLQQECVENNVIDNEVQYAVPLDGNCAVIEVCNELSGSLPAGDWEILAPTPGFAIFDTLPPTFELPDYGTYPITDGDRVLTIRAVNCDGYTSLAKYRNRSGTATICSAFLPLTGESSPPVRYLTKRTSGVMSVCRSTESNCLPPTCPGAVTFSGSVVSDYSFSWTGSLTPTGPEAGGFIPYQATMNVTHNGGFMEGPPRITLLTAGIEWNTNGQTVNVPVGVAPVDTASFQVFIFLAGGYVTYQNKCITVSYLPTIRDTWDKTENYSALDCSPATIDNSDRIQSINSPACPAISGTDVPGEPTSPTAYLDIDTVTTATTQTITGGEECRLIIVPLADDYYERTTGQIEVELLNEDDEASAINRLFGGNPEAGWTPWLSDGSSGCVQPSCSLSGTPVRTTLVFPFKQGQWQGQASGLNPLGSYSWRYQEFRRPWGSSEDFVFFATHYYPATVLGDGSSSITNVFVPVESGFESYASKPTIVKAL